MVFGGEWDFCGQAAHLCLITSELVGPFGAALEGEPKSQRPCCCHSGPGNQQQNSRGNASGSSLHRWLAGAVHCGWCRAVPATVTQPPALPGQAKGPLAGEMLCTHIGKCRGRGVWVCGIQIHWECQHWCLFVLLYRLHIEHGQKSWPSLNPDLKSSKTVSVGLYIAHEQRGSVTWVSPRLNLPGAAVTCERITHLDVRNSETIAILVTGKEAGWIKTQPCWLRNKRVLYKVLIQDPSKSRGKRSSNSQMQLN